jgi:hypothetical protein
VHPVTFEPVVPEIVLGHSAHSRSLPAVHVVYGRPNQVDGCLFHRKLIYPTPMHEEWHDDARWPYHGIPEAIVIGLMRPDAKQLAGIPPANPTALITDNAWIYHSQAFRDNVRSYGGSVQYAREWTPTDKAMIERTFGILNVSLFELLPGYRGPDIHSSAVNAHLDDLMWHEDFELLILEWIARYWQVRDHGGLFFGEEPHMGLTPNDMFEKSVVEYGFNVPINRDGRYLHLPRLLLDVTRRGLRWGDWTYESDDLGFFRDEGKSPWAHLGRKWPVRFDPEDITVLYIQNHKTGEWFEIPWRGRAQLGRPFSLDGRDHVRHIARQRGRRPRTEAQITEFALEVIERREAMRAIRRKGLAELRELSFGPNGSGPPDRVEQAISVPVTGGNQLRPLNEISRRGALSDAAPGGNNA